MIATNGEEALERVAEVTPDLILLDWMMPLVSGIEVCRQLKTRPETRAIPVIMLSARSEEVDKVRGLETGADDYVIKPYSLVELMARLRAHLRRTRPPQRGLCWNGAISARSGNPPGDAFEKQLKLGPTEFRLVATFLEAGAGVQPRCPA